MKIGEKLRTARLAKGFSIYKLSKITFVSQNHICAIENDKRQPTLETLERLIAPLGITLAELLNPNPDVSYLSDDEKELLKNYRALPSDSASLLLLLSHKLKSHL